MKKVMLLVLTVMLVSAFLMAGTVKPPPVLRLEVVNKAGEPIKLEMTGTGYDFKKEAHIWAGGAYHWLPYQDPPINPSTKEYMNVPAYGAYDLPRDRYIIRVVYQQEIDGEPGDAIVRCLMNWVPDGYEDNVAYFDMDRNRKLTVGKCNLVPRVLPGRKSDAVKWARWLFVVK